MINSIEELLLPVDAKAAIAFVADRRAGVYRQAANDHQWPSLGELRLSPEVLDWRRSGIGGSDANIIFSGDPERVRKLWLEKRGGCEPEDLSDRLPVVLGRWTEEFNRLWFEQCTGERVIDMQVTRTSKEQPWRRCTLDGTLERNGAVWEAKHCSAFAKPEELLARYMPQLQHNMAVADRDHAVLSVIFGNHKHEVIEVRSDWLYQLELLEAEERFWESVIQGEEPPVIEVPKPPKPVGVREACLQGNNSWATAAVDWLQHREAAKLHSGACTTIKELVEGDVSRAFGHGIEVKRSKSGALSIRELRS